MASTTLTQDSLLPQPTGGLAPGALAALLVHVGLIAALSISIDWRSRQPEVVAAELWASVPQTTAPAPPPPPVAVTPTPPAPPAPPVAKPPAQPDPDIALERDRRLKAEKLKLEEDLKKAEADRKRKADEKKADEKKADEKKAEAERKKQEVAEEKAEDERLAKQRQENLRRIMGQAGNSPTTGGTGTATQNAAPSADYLARLRKMLRDQINFNGTVPGNAATEVVVNTASGGTIISRTITKRSGHDEWDKAVIRALDKLGTMPRELDGRVPPSFTLVFRQND